MSFLSNTHLNNGRALLALLALSCTGCAAQWCHLPDDCAHAFGQTQLGWEINDLCENGLPTACACGEGPDCGCGVFVDDSTYDGAVYLDDADFNNAYLGEPELAHRPRIAVGPPPEPYVPPMPPKFLPVPTRSVF